MNKTQAFRAFRLIMRALFMLLIVIRANNKRVSGLEELIEDFHRFLVDEGETE